MENNTNSPKSILAIWVESIYKNSTPKERRELDRYDTIEFVDVNKEIKKLEEKK